MTDTDAERMSEQERARILIEAQRQEIVRLRAVSADTLAALKAIIQDRTVGEVTQASWQLAIDACRKADGRDG